MFNTENVNETHWLYKAFFNEETKGNYDKYSIKKIFCNYTDNYFIDQQEYLHTLWLSAVFNEQRFMEIARGEWGSLKKDNLFIYALRNKERKDKNPGYAHITEGMTVDYPLPVILSFDFNLNPMSCLVIQHDLQANWVSVIQEYRIMDSDIFEMCQRIKTDHPNAFFIVTGDATGRNRSAMTKGKKNYYQIIKEELNISSAQIKLPGINPSIANTRTMCNLLFEKHPALLINKSCYWLIQDFNNVTTDGEGGIDKKKDAALTHLLDTFRYYVFMYWSDYYKQIRK